MCATCSGSARGPAGHDDTSELEWSCFQTYFSAIGDLPSMLASVLLHGHSSRSPRGECLSAAVKPKVAVSLSLHVLAMHCTDRCASQGP